MSECVCVCVCVCVWYVCERKCECERAHVCECLCERPCVCMHANGCARVMHVCVGDIKKSENECEMC